MDCKASLLAEFTSSFGMRIMCVNALFEEEVTLVLFLHNSDLVCLISFSHDIYVIELA